MDSLKIRDSSEKARADLVPLCSRQEFLSNTAERCAGTKKREADSKIRLSVDDTNNHGVLPEDRVASLCWVSSRTSLRRVQSARFTQLTSRAVDPCFRGPREEQAHHAPFSSQPDSFWFKSPLLAFRTPLQPKLMRDAAWQRERLSALVPPNKPSVPSGVRWEAPSQAILRCFDSVPLLHLASTSEIRKVIRQWPSACASNHYLPPSNF